MNEKFAKHASVLSVGEREAKKELNERNRLRELEVHKKNIKEESRMREAANSARQEKSKIIQELKDQSESGNLNKRPSPYILEAEEGKAERDQMRYIKRREIERERKIEVGFLFEPMITNIYLGVRKEKIEDVKRSRTRYL